MAEELQYTVKFKTTSDGSGAKQTAAAINDVVSATEKLNKTTAEGKANRDLLERALSDSADKARVNEIAFYDLDAAQTRTKNTAEELGTGVEAVGKKSAQFGQNMLQAAYAADDLQYGLRGIVNNVPMLAQAFGLAPAMAGGIAIAAVALNQILPLIQQALSGTAELKETADQVLTNAANAALNKLEKRKGELEDSVKKLEVETTPDDAGAQAKQDALDSYAQQLRTITTVSEQLNQLLGRQTTALETMAAKAAADATAREAATAAALEAEEKKVEAARRALNLAEAAREARVIERQDAKFAAEMAAKEVRRLEERRDLLAQTASQRVGWAQALGDGSVLPGQKTAAAEVATVDLQNTQIQLDAAAVNANELSSAAEQMAQVLGRYDQVIEGAKQSLERQQEASAQNVETILRQQGVEEMADEAASLQAATSDIATRLKTVMTSVGEQTGVAGEAVAGINGYIADSDLNLAELRQVPTKLQILNATYRGNFSGLSAAVEDLVAATNLAVSRIERLENASRATKASAANRGVGSP